MAVSVTPTSFIHSESVPPVSASGWAGGEAEQADGEHVALGIERDGLFQGAPPRGLRSRSG